MPYRIAYAGDRIIDWNKPHKPLEYLAAPYTHEDAAVRLERFDAINRTAARLFKAGRHIYSPMSHTLPIAIAGGIVDGFEFWRDYDASILAKCDRLLVLCLDGWKESVGVQTEISWAYELGIPIEYMEEE